MGKQEMVTLAGTRLSMCTKPQQTAEMNASYCDSCLNCDSLLPFLRIGIVPSLAANALLTSAPALGGPELFDGGGRGDVPDAVHAGLVLLPLPPHPLRRRRPLLTHLLQAQAQVVRLYCIKTWEIAPF